VKDSPRCTSPIGRLRKSRSAETTPIAPLTVPKIVASTKPDMIRRMALNKQHLIEQLAARLKQTDEVAQRMYEVMPDLRVTVEEMALDRSEIGPEDAVPRLRSLAIPRRQDR
jgi:hypothetical protein